MITAERARHLFSYDRETGILYWKSPLSKRHKPGDVAGCMFGSGYMRVNVDGVSLAAHRLAWLIENGELPDQVDHVNSCRHDNRIANLRAANNSLNQRNTLLRVTSKTGLKGVHWLASRERFMAQLCHDGKRHNRKFKTIFDAAAWIIPIRERLHGEFANHGMPLPKTTDAADCAAPRCEVLSEITY